MSQSFSDRDALLHTWLSQVFANQQFTHERLAGDASFRGYHRLTVNDGKKTAPYIVMDAPPDKESVATFVAVDKLMSEVVHVPALIAVNITDGFIVLEDLGTTDFADLLTEHNMATNTRLYHQAMDCLLAIQRLDINSAKTVIPAYDADKLHGEMALFAEWFLPYIGVTLEPMTEKLWEAVQQQIITTVQQQRQVVVHRDFHSRNLMVTENDLGVIDFQDAVIGAYSYDLVSLLRDAYVNWSEAQTQVWFDDFYQRLQPIMPHLTKADFMADHMVMGLQRHLKILGIFVRLYQRDGKSRYLANLPRVLHDTLLEAQWLAQHHAGIYADFYTWLNATIQPVFDRKVADQ